jgi:hypothetical protein
MTVAQATLLVELTAAFGLLSVLGLFILEVVTRGQRPSSNMLNLRSSENHQAPADHELAA